MKRSFSLASIILLVASHAFAGEGAPYGARDPETCPSRSAPASGAPSAEQAKHYLGCEIEHVSGSMLYLLADVKVQVASSPRPYEVRHDIADQIDPQKPVYDIRGSYLKYQCPLTNSYDGEHFPGKHCSYANETNASGLCWQTSFGEWRCRMIDVMHLSNTVNHVPPPK